MLKEQTVQRTRIHQHKIQRERPWQEVLPPDPRDPDVVRAKALARTGDRTGGTTARQHRTARPRSTVR